MDREEKSAYEWRWDPTGAEIDWEPAKGAITVKRISGKECEYWQFRENGRQITKRVKGEELDTLRVQISKRKRLEELLKEHGAKKRTDLLH